MDNKLTNTLPTWVTPRLLRLNQADGTDKHVLIAEGASTQIPQPTCGGGYAYNSGNGGVCGPS